MKTILYYRTIQYGNRREFVHPDNAADGKLIQSLTGQRTIDSRVRELIHDLSGGEITFTETLAP